MIDGEASRIASKALAANLVENATKVICDVPIMRHLQHPTCHLVVTDKVLATDSWRQLHTVLLGLLHYFQYGYVHFLFTADPSITKIRNYQCVALNQGHRFQIWDCIASCDDSIGDICCIYGDANISDAVQPVCFFARWKCSKFRTGIVILA
jgi:hypothetical protein